MTPQHRSHKQQGFLLVLAAVLIVIIGFLGVALSFLITSDVRSGSDHFESARALFLAESGLERGILSWSQNAAYAGEGPTNFANGSFTIAAPDQDSSSFPVALGLANPLPVGQRHIRSSGQYGSAVRVVEAIIDSGGAGGIALDNSSNKKRKNKTDATWKHNIAAAGLNRFLLVGIAVTNTTISSVAYNGVAMTLVGVRNGTGVRVELWQLINPAAGNNNIDVVFASSGDMVAGAISLTGVDQSNPIEAFQTNAGGSGPASVGITTVSDNAWVIDTLGVLTNNTVSAVPPQVQQWNDVTTGGGGGTRVIGAGSIRGPVSPAAALSMQWTLSSNRNWAMAAVAIKPAAGATAILYWREVFS